MTDKNISFINMNHFDDVHIFLSVLWVPFSFNDDGFIRMRRIIPASAVDDKMVKYILRSFECTIGGKQYRSTDEEMFIYSY